VVGFPQFDTADFQCGVGDGLRACANAYNLTLEFAGSGFENFIIISSGGSSSGVGSYMASNDPTIEIDPTFAAAHPGIGMVESSNVGNGGSAAPEPASIAMLGAGLLSFVAKKWLARTT
jgi:hypothetical protein